MGVWMITLLFKLDRGSGGMDVLLFKPERGSGGMDDNRMFTAIVLA